MQSDFVVKIPTIRFRWKILPRSLTNSTHPTAIESAYLVVSKFGRDWLSPDRQDTNIKDFADHVGAHPESISALHKLKRLENFDFLQERVVEDAVFKIMEFLDKGTNIVLDSDSKAAFSCFHAGGQYLVRRHPDSSEKPEQYLASGRPQEKPKQLIITIEEAHKFLNPMAARQTIFGTIAREMRKYSCRYSLSISDPRVLTTK